MALRILEWPLESDTSEFASAIDLIRIEGGDEFCGVESFEFGHQAKNCRCIQFHKNLYGLNILWKLGLVQSHVAGECCGIDFEQYEFFRGV